MKAEYDGWETPSGAHNRGEYEGSEGTTVCADFSPARTTLKLPAGEMSTSFVKIFPKKPKSRSPAPKGPLAGCPIGRICGGTAAVLGDL